MTEMNSVRIPSPDPICLRGDNPLQNIQYFGHQWKYYCLATGLDQVSKEKKVATFLLYIGREAFRFIRDNLDLSDDRMTDCDKILAALENSHKPNFNVLYERFVFNQAVQEDGETVDEFADKLKILAERCKFEEHVDEMMRDRFIVGLKTKEYQTSLLSERNLSLSKAVRLCKAKETLATSTDLESVHPSSLQNGDKVGGGSQKLRIDAHSTLKPVAETKSQPDLHIKEEKFVAIADDNDDDDLMIVSHTNGDSCDILDISSFYRPAKRVKVEVETLEPESPTNATKEIEEVEPPSADTTTNVNHIDAKVGSFVVLREDWNKMRDPPIWKVDSADLLQKFIPVEHNGVTLYKSTAVYSGWTQNALNQYYKASVLNYSKQSNRKESLVQFLKDLVPTENQIDKVTNGVSRKRPL